MFFLAWTAALGKILTIDNLRRHRVRILDCFYMCKKSGEMVNHLLLHCENVWSLVFCLFGIRWVMLHRVLNVLAYWKGCFSQRGNIVVWNVVPLCVIGLVWRVLKGQRG